MIKEKTINRLNKLALIAFGLITVIESSLISIPSLEKKVNVTGEKIQFSMSEKE